MPLLLALALDVGAQPVSFTRTDVPSVSGARAMATADFDRDGRPDVALANIGRETVTILLNRGGSLARIGDVAVGVAPFDLAAGDLDRDGIPDLAVANADSQSISVLRGKGDGTFTRSDIATPSQNPRGIAVADVNNDGKPDVIYSGYATGIVQALLGDGAGGFGLGPSSTLAGSHPQGLAAADFNHDGRIDVAVAYADANGLRVLYRSGSGFTGRSVAGDGYLNVVVAADFDRDGWTDVAGASTTYSTTTVYRGSANGLTGSHTYFVGPSPRGIAAGDLNDDGLLDLVTANRGSSTVSVLIADRSQPGAFLAPLELASATGSRTAVVADFDGDGGLDIVSAGEYSSTATVLSNRTALAPAAYAMRRVRTNFGQRVGHTFPDEMWTADFDHDGALDVALSDGTVLLASGAASTPLPEIVAVDDIDHDGNDDVVVREGHPDYSVRTYLGDGHGGFTAAPRTPWEQIRNCATADMNGDGRADLVCMCMRVIDSAYFLQVALGRGDGSFVHDGPVLLLPDVPFAIAVADVNRDGAVDAIVSLSEFRRNAGAEILTFNGDGRGALAATSSLQLPESFAAQIAVADVNRDGYIDLIVGAQPQLLVALGSAAGFTAPRPQPFTSSGSARVAVSDLNRDGHPDVALGTGDVLFGNGDGSFAPAGRFQFGILGIAELTGDGLPDLFTRSGTGAVVLANTRDTVNHPPTLEPLPDRTLSFASTQGSEDCDVQVTAVADDLDAHALVYEWSVDGGPWSASGAVIGLCGPPPGTRTYSVRVSDGRGAIATDSFTVTIEPIKEIVLWAADAEYLSGSGWRAVADSTAAGGVRAYDANLGAPKATAPLPFPQMLQRMVAFRFIADPTQTYKLWVRLKADGDYWGNDSVWVQFSGATDVAGAPKYGIGSSSGLPVNLEECSGCGESGWGWEDDGWGAPDRSGVLLRFPQNPDRDAQMLVIHTREDGVSIDQIVLSAEKYLVRRPGTAKNDTTILPATQPRR